MDRLRPRPRQRQRQVFSGFTTAEIEKMEKLFLESRELLQSKEFCQKIARNFSSSSGRAGKPIVKWTEVQSWFVARQQESTSKFPSLNDTSKNQSRIPETCPLNNGHQSSQILKGMVSNVGERVPDLSELEFEAKSSKDGAWYDVDMFLSRRFLSSGEAERRDQSIYYDAHVIEIERKTHDIRGCRCLFLIRYDHDSYEERVRLRRLCRIQGQQNR